MYDGVLKLSFPRGVKIVGFADDVVLVVIGESVEEVEILATEAVDAVEEWMRGKKLVLAHHKTEVVMISNRKAVQKARISVGQCTIDSKREVRHLGVMIDDRLSFNSHVDYTCERAVKVISALSRIMPNNSAISSSKKRLLASVSTSVLRYAGPVWVTALQTKRNRSRLNSTFRLMAMRVASAYRTISSEAVCVIAGLIPISLQLEEDSECYRDRRTRGIRKRARDETMRKWQQQWDSAENGRWTHRLIPCLSTWVNRKHGEVNFHLTQFLSGHGCFKKYLNRFGHARSPLCTGCGDVDETPEHVVFECPRFEHERAEMTSVVGNDVNVHNIVRKMCADEEKWDAVNRTIVQMMSLLQRRWREEQRHSTQRTAHGSESLGQPESSERPWRLSSQPVEASI